MGIRMSANGCQLDRCEARDVVAKVNAVEGWLTDEQAHQLWHSASQLEPEQRIVEIGSFRGRSTIALALGAPDGVEVLAIDPHSGVDRAPQESDLNLDVGAEDAEVFTSNLARFGVTDKVSHIAKASLDALDDVPEPVHVLFIDGAHGFRTARHDIVAYGHLVAEDGTILLHDSFSSPGVTLALLSTLVSTQRFRYVGRTGSLAIYRRTTLSAAERIRNGAAQLAELPWYVRNAVIRRLVFLRQERLVRALGHTSGPWPF
jgi:predicted O-methyltransferase YrrM